MRRVEKDGLVQLDWLAGHYPSQLSGGQRQRVALARALAVEPHVLLLDEPFGALDAKVRKELRRWLRRLHDETGLTSIFVTHDQEEALEVADRIVVMNHGRVEQQGSPGRSTTIRHRLSSSSSSATLTSFMAGRGSSPKARPWWPMPVPHEVGIGPWSGVSGEGIEGQLLRAHLAGPSARLELKLVASGETLEAEIAKERYLSLGLTAGSAVTVAFPRLKLYPKEAPA